jgi:hypothetical protein
MSAMALDYSVDSTTEVEAAVALGAEGTIQGWRPLVAGLSQWAQRSARRAPLEDLTRWYERASGDSSFAEDPPLEGLDALTDELTEPRIYDGLWYMAGARWAIRVCEELVHWRAVRADKDARPRFELRSTVWSSPLRLPGDTLATSPPDRGLKPRSVF